jgi:hypothetical protein
MTPRELNTEKAQGHRQHDRDDEQNQTCAGGISRDGKDVKRHSLRPAQESRPAPVAIVTAKPRHAQQSFRSAITKGS